VALPSKNSVRSAVACNVVDYPPSPLDVVDYMGFKPGDETETRNIPRRADDDMALALAFKIMNDPFVGKFPTFARFIPARKG
jgi:elongation factor G